MVLIDGFAIWASLFAKYPRVGALRYSLRMASQYLLDESVCRSGEVAGFRYRLRYYSAEFQPSQDFSSVDEARQALDPILAAWHVSALLHMGPAAYAFEFTDGYVDDTLRMALTRHWHPPRWRPMPPTNVQLTYFDYAEHLPWITVDDCVRDLSEHLLASSLSTRGLLLHAYAIATRVEAKHGSRREAAEALNVSQHVLSKLTRLASERGVGANARKFTDNLPRASLSGEETQFVNDAMRVLVYRSSLIAGGHSAGPYYAVDQITATAW